MSINDALGMRMKEYYEAIPKSKLMRRTPVAIRIDGKAFHTFTRGFEKPFDRVLIKSMRETMEYLCKNIQGCVFGYTQSDEITLILIDYQNLNSSAWFDYEVQKMCSIAASMATIEFNKRFDKNTKEEILLYKTSLVPQYMEIQEQYQKYHDTLLAAVDKGAMFDARCFNIPKEEVANLIYWRQLDAIRNSIQMCGQKYFSHKELQGKSCNVIQDMLLTQKNFNWDLLPVPFKRGTACRKILREVNIAGTIDTIFSWELDHNMPILKEDWHYINQYIYVNN